MCADLKLLLPLRFDKESRQPKRARDQQSQHNREGNAAIRSMIDTSGIRVKLTGTQKLCSFK
jgi:hypothetical protein